MTFKITRKAESEHAVFGDLKAGEAFRYEEVNDIYVKIHTNGFTRDGQECNLVRLTSPLLALHEEDHQVVIRTTVECKELA